MRTILVIMLMLLLTACGSGAASTDGRLDVVAAENVYGNIAAQIGGRHVSVTSILTSPNADPRPRAAYRAGVSRFDRSLGPLRREVAAIRASFRGAAVAYTEPVPGYLVTAAGLRNLAPDSFTRQIEDGTEPSPSSVAAMDE